MIIKIKPDIQHWFRQIIIFIPPPPRVTVDHHYRINVLLMYCFIRSHTLHSLPSQTIPNRFSMKIMQNKILKMNQIDYYVVICSNHIILSDSNNYSLWRIIKVFTLNPIKIQRYNNLYCLLITSYYYVNLNPYVNNNFRS